METPKTPQEVPVIPSQPEIETTDPGTPLIVPDSPETGPGAEPGIAPRPDEMPQSMRFPE